MKKRYEKPEMLVETFVATQSVALSCGDAFKSHEPIEVSPGMPGCGDKGCGHTVGNNILTQGKDLGTYQIVVDDLGNQSVEKLSDEKDNKVVLFSAGYSCELNYEDPSVGGTVAGLGKLVNGNNAWSSNQHSPALGDVKIPS